MRAYELLEASRSAPLYHGTSIGSALSMLKDEIMNAGTSLTRSYRVAQHFADKAASEKLHDLNIGDPGDPMCALEFEADMGTFAIIRLDQAKLMHNVGLRPYDWFHSNGHNDGGYERGTEFEEVTKRAASPVSRYITGIETYNFEKFAALVVERLPEYSVAVAKMRSLLKRSVDPSSNLGEAKQQRRAERIQLWTPLDESWESDLQLGYSQFEQRWEDHTYDEHTRVDSPLLPFEKYVDYAHEIAHELGGIALYRGMRIHPDQLNNLAHLGVHWSRDWTIAKGFAHSGWSIYDDRFSRPVEGSVPVIIAIAPIDPNQCDIVETLAVTIYGGEDEVCMKRDQSVKIAAVYVNGVLQPEHPLVGQTRRT